MKPKYCFGTAFALKEQGYHNRHICIIMNCHEQELRQMLKSPAIESTLKFITPEEKIRLYVLDKILQLKPVSLKWCSDDYYYITILKFLLVPRETIYLIYKSAPHIPVAQAHKEKSPIFQPFDYAKLNISLSEYKLFVQACYKYINDPTMWR